MKDFLKIWDEIQSESRDYEDPDYGISDSIYMTEDFVFDNKDENTDYLWRSEQVINKLGRLGANVPNVCFSSREHNLIVYERIGGEPLQEMEEPGRRTGVAVGETLDTIHEPSFSEFGDIETDIGVIDTDGSDIKGEFSDLESYTDNVIQKTEDFIHDGSEYIQAFETAASIAEDSEKSFEESSICHYDYCGKNIIISEGQAYAIDFDFCELGLSGADLVHAYLQINHRHSSEFMEGFFEGYGRRIDDLSDIEIALGVLWEVGCGCFMERELKGGERRAERLYDFLEQQL